MIWPNQTKKRRATPISQKKAKANYHMKIMNQAITANKNQRSMKSQKLELGFLPSKDDRWKRDQQVRQLSSRQSGSSALFSTVVQKEMLTQCFSNLE